MKARFILLLYCILHFSSSQSQTTIPGGNVSGTWAAVGSPYYVTNSIMIPDQQTLVILPGVTVIFTGHYKLVVKGKLRAQGTSAANIVFTASNTTQGWWGIRIDAPLPANDSTVLSYCVIEHGNANTINDESRGGGMFLKGAKKVRIDHCLFQFNKSIDRGGAFYSENSGFLLLSSQFSQNTSVNYGGAICSGNNNAIPGSSIHIEGNSILSNSASLGGGIDLWGIDKPIVLSNFIMSNSSGVLGSVADVYFANNVVSANGTGVFFSSFQNGSFIGNTITENYGNQFAGMLLQALQSVLVERNIISNNHANGNAGLYLTGSPGTPTVQNNIIVNNLAKSSTNYGGGLTIYGCNGLFQNNTIANNHAVGRGGGVAVRNFSDPVFKNNIVYGNTADITGAQFFFLDEDSDPDFFNNDIQGGLNGMEFNGNFFTGIYQNNIDQDPLFDLPTAGAGTTFAGYNANWWLQNGSPCIDAGSPTGLYPPTDYAMSARVAGAAIDMGAYEKAAPVGLIAVEEQNARVFPNPFNTQTKVSIDRPLEKAEIIIYDNLGKEVRRLENINGSYAVIARQDLRCGVYYLRLTNGAQIYVSKLFVAD